MKGAASLFASRGMTLAPALVAACYFTLEKIGLFRLAPASTREVFHSTPFLALSVLLALNAVAMLVARSNEDSRIARVGRALFHLSVVLLVAALWVSYLTRFEGKAIRMQRQAFNGFRGDYIPKSLYMGRFARVPQVGVLMNDIVPFPTKDMGGLRKAEAAISYAGKWTSGPIGGRLSSRWPLFTDWTLITLSDFGYTVRFVIEDPWKRPIDADYVSMKLFPPGKEDFFKSYLLPFTFFLKLYPEHVEKGGQPATLSPYLKNPLFQLRITRNKDIVYNDTIRPTEHLRFENLVLSLPETRMWVEMTFVRDLGLPVAAAGLLLMISGAALITVGRMRKGKGRAR